MQLEELTTTFGKKYFLETKQTVRNESTKFLKVNEVYKLIHLAAFHLEKLCTDHSVGGRPHTQRLSILAKEVVIAHPV